MKTRITDFRKVYSDGFTIVELLVVTGVLGILMALATISLANAKQRGREIVCLNQLKQVSIAAKLYASENSDFLPPISAGVEDSWIYRLSSYYNNQHSLLKCPSVRGADRFTYVINGWNDYWKKHLSDEDFNRFQRRQLTVAMQLSAVPLPSDTLLFGEKNVGSRHVHMDLYQGTDGNDREEVDEARHRTGVKVNAGSNYAVVDGSVRFIKQGRVTVPVNLWAVTDEWRFGRVQ